MSRHAASMATSTVKMDDIFRFLLNWTEDQSEFIALSGIGNKI